MDLHQLLAQGAEALVSDSDDDDQRDREIRPRGAPGDEAHGKRREDEVIGYELVELGVRGTGNAESLRKDESFL